MLCASPGFQAPPGAGKTTVVPLAMLLHDPEYLSTAAAGGKKIMVLEPRRVAAKAAARRMASMLGEAVGETVGYRVKLDTRIGPRTRIEVRASGWFSGSSATPHCCAHLICMMRVVTDGILILWPVPFLCHPSLLRTPNLYDAGGDGRHPHPYAAARPRADGNWRRPFR